MTYVLDDPIKIGDFAFSVLSHAAISHHSTRVLKSFTCSKNPLVVLTLRNSQIGAYDISGNPMALEDVERLYPGIIERFKTAGDGRSHPSNTARLQRRE